MNIPPSHSSWMGIRSTPAKAGCYLSSTAITIGLLALLVIGCTIAGAYMHKAIRLIDGNINKAELLKWAEAAKWTGVAIGGAAVLAILSVVLDKSIKACKKRSQYSQLSQIE